MDDRLDFVPPSYATFGLDTEPQGPRLPGDSRIVLDLLGAIEYAVTHARDYQDRMEDLYLATLDVTLERHLFEPRPFANTTFRYQGDQGGTRGHQGSVSSDFQSALSVMQRVGIRQQLPYGGEIVAEQLVSVRTDALIDNDGRCADRPRRRLRRASRCSRARGW